MSKVIHKKTWSSIYKEVESGNKTFDLRLADWDCQEGDVLVLDEVDDKTKQPTGRSIRKKVGFVLKTNELSFFSKEDIAKHGLQVISLVEEKV